MQHENLRLFRNCCGCILIFKRLGYPCTSRLKHPWSLAFENKYATTAILEEPNLIFTVKNNNTGFTLIELLIVIVIISIVSSIALLTISHNKNKNMEYFAHEFVQRMILAEHEAMLRPTTLGVGLTPTSYQFYIYNIKTQWSLLNDKNLNHHSIPGNIQVILKMNDQIVELNGKPVIIISESSDITPFTIFIGEHEKHTMYQIIGHANGNITSEPVYEEFN